MSDSTTTLDFTTIARDLSAARGEALDSDRQLVPAEACSRMRREGNRFRRRPSANGATVDQEGLTNNYAIEPQMYAAVFPSPEQARQYAVQAAAATLLVVSLIMISAAVS